MGEKGVGKLSRETPPPREGEPMGAMHAKFLTRLKRWRVPVLSSCVPFVACSEEGC